MGINDSNRRSSDSSPDGDSSGPHILDSSKGMGTPPPPPPPPPPPIWNAPDDDPGWQVGEFPAGYGEKSKRSSGGDYYGYDEKAKRKRGLYDDGTGRTFAWHEAWIAAVTQPAVATYEALIRDPRASLQRAALWLGGLALLMYLVPFGFLGLGSSSFESLIGSTVAMVMCAPVMAALMVAMMAIGWGLQYAAARILGGKGTYEEQFYASACYTAPLMIASLAGVIPCLGGLVALGLAVYQAVLNVIAVKAVHGFDWGRAFISVFWFLILMCGCMMCLLVMAAPTMGNVFQQALDALYTPTP